MMLCLQILARHKHDLIKKYSFSRGSWQRGCQLWDVSSHGFRRDFGAKPPKTWPEWRKKQVAAFWSRFPCYGDACQVTLRAFPLEFYPNVARSAAGLLPPVGCFLGLSFRPWDKVQRSLRSCLVWLHALLQHTDRELWLCLSLLADLRAKICKISIC